MGRVIAWFRSIGGWLRRPRTELPRWQRGLRLPWDVTWRTVKELWREDGSQVADALTYRTLFSLLPMLVVMLAIVQAFRGVEYFEREFADDVIEFVLPAQFREVEGALEPVAPGTAAADAAEAARAEYQLARRELGDRLRDLLDGLKDVNFGGLGAVGLLLFIYGATGLLGIIESSFNRILNVKGERPLGRRLMLYYTILTLAPLVLAVGQVARNKALAVLDTGAWADWTDWLMGPAVVLSPLVTSWAVILAMFLLLPSTRVPFRQAAIGAAISAVLWLLAREAFAWYARTTAISSVYGAVALVPVFLLWLWLSWFLVLLGLEFADVLRRVAVQGWEEPRPQRTDRLVEPAWLVPLVARVAADFERGERTSQADLAERLGLGEKDVADLLAPLAAAGYVRREDDEGGATSWTLARPAERIPLGDVLRIGREHVLGGPPETDGPSWQLVDRLREAEQATVGDRTVADLVRTEAEEREGQD